MREIRWPKRKSLRHIRLAKQSDLCQSTSLNVTQKLLPQKIKIKKLLRTHKTKYKKITLSKGLKLKLTETLEHTVLYIYLN